MGSNAVSQSAVSTVVGYDLEKGYFSPDTPYLPQSISIFGEANTAQQTGLSTNRVQITSARQAANLYGDGSPIYSIARILFPPSGGGVSVPVYIYPQAAAAGSVAKVITITPTGTATDNGSIIVNISGRDTLDGASYQVNIVTGDTPTDICDKIRTAVAAAYGCPVTGSGTTTAVLTAKWTGLTSNDIKVVIDTSLLPSAGIGVTFAVANTTAGTGTPAVTTSLNMFGNEWRTLVINSYGLVDAVMDELEAYNGIPNPNGTATGRYAGIVWKPILALSGTTVDDPTSITDARPDNVTIVTCPAPLSNGMPYEAAANMAVLLSNIAQNSPHLDVINLKYPDMPPAPAGSIPAMNDYTTRDSFVKKGCSTVDYISGVYQIKDLVTTYHPAGENPPRYQFVRDLVKAFNIRYKYYLREVAKLVGKTICKDSDIVTVGNVMKPKMWRAQVEAHIDECVALALMADAAFAKKSINVTINSGNPNRMDTEYSDKTTGIVRISATTETSDFYYGR